MYENYIGAVFYIDNLYEPKGIKNPYYLILRSHYIVKDDKFLKYVSITNKKELEKKKNFVKYTLSKDIYNRVYISKL